MGVFENLGGTLFLGPYYLGILLFRVLYKGPLFSEAPILPSMHHENSIEQEDPRP